jgi:GT2 family glycosyltransferase
MWIGVLDLDSTAPVQGASNPSWSDELQARILVRWHRVPVGYVRLAVAPAQTLTERARAEAKSALAVPLRQHQDWDEPGSSQQWASQVACPRRFPPSRNPGVSIIVCTRDRPAELRECLHSLRQVTYSPVEFVIVDNAPGSAGTKELVTEAAREDSRVRYACEPQPGLSQARNHGLARARYDLVAFTDDDTLVDPGWPLALVAGFAADPATVCVTGLVVPWALDTKSQRYHNTRYYAQEIFEPRRYDLVEHRYPSGLYPFTAGLFGVGANFAVRRQAVESIGGFDPLLGAGSLGRGGEDLDIFLRLILSGGRISYLPSAFVWHKTRKHLQPLGDQVYDYGHGLGAYLAKHSFRRELQVALVRHGLPYFGGMVTRIRLASQASQLGLVGGRLALHEWRGLVVGAVRFSAASYRHRGAGAVPDDARARTLTRK